MSSIQTQVISQRELEQLLRDREADLDRRRRLLPQIPKTAEEIKAAQVFQVLWEDYQKIMGELAVRRVYAMTAWPRLRARDPRVGTHGSDQTSPGSHVGVGGSALLARIRRPDSAPGSVVAGGLRKQELPPRLGGERPHSVPPQDWSFMQQSAPSPDHDSVTPSAPPAEICPTSTDDSRPPLLPPRTGMSPPPVPSAPPQGVLGSFSDATS